MCHGQEGDCVVMKKVTSPKNLSVHSSTAEYLTFIASTGDTAQNIEVRYEDENIWLTQKALSALYEVEVPTINYHIKKIIDDMELDESAVIRNFQITGSDGKNYNTKHYDLSMIISVGFKVNSQKAVQVRKWAGELTKNYTIRGYVLDKERFMESDLPLTKEYFDHLLEDIREIRLSERRFYQKITDIYATSIDYDFNSKTTHDFFATVQNKLHWAIHGHTAAELIMERANHEKPNMGLTSWRKAPQGKIEKSDVSIAKNYLEKNELEQLERIVTMYLDYAEYQALHKNPMTMEGWVKKLDAFLQFNEEEILHDSGRVSHEIAKAFAEKEYILFRSIQDKSFKSDFDHFLEETKRLENKGARAK